ncbi:hypothetical protein [uncultured Alistipes sp.]|uniref:hypothetical protein n=1 Tax=uncultured Alistipes sp. TaxID=538949 RepID=UPI0026228C3B|nr:hypothetical protein [uncultured Alistipes sp.]
MIDNLTIRLEGFSGSFENCERVKENGNIAIYRLKGLSLTTPHPLTLILAKRSGTLYIVNSLRKWYYGRASLLDFTSGTLLHAFKLLAGRLKISYEELSRGRVTQVEAGLNLRTRISCQRLFGLIAGYKTRPRNSIKNETLYFGDRTRGVGYKKVMLYDKTAEIVARMPLRKRFRQEEIFEVLARHGYFFPRYEFKLADRQALSQNGLDIRTVSDLVAGYEELYRFLAREARNFVLFERIGITERMTPKERLIAEGLNEYGYTEYLERCRETCRSRTVKGLKSARYKVRKDLIRVIDRYDTGDYGSRQFRIDLGRNLVRISKHDPALNLTETLRELFIGRPASNNKRNK